MRSHQHVNNPVLRSINYVLGWIFIRHIMRTYSLYRSISGNAVAAFVDYVVVFVIIVVAVVAVVIAVPAAAADTNAQIGSPFAYCSRIVNGITT